MANPNLTSEQRENLFAPLFKQTTAELTRLSGGDPDLLFALRRKLFKELGYLERGHPSDRNKIKALKRIQQEDRCALCNTTLPKSHAELDRFEAKKGYTVENTRLVCHQCHIDHQRAKNYM